MYVVCSTAIVAKVRNKLNAKSAARYAQLPGKQLVAPQLQVQLPTTPDRDIGISALAYNLNLMRYDKKSTQVVWAGETLVH